ncbi:MAG: DUF4156 domain-containing protein [Gammaproteobacteria bacterium]|nr:DUF4156 domain-containing protein [Gammaproteobacteria bacterium]MCW8972029.1 DUF4156 domain-containing protein [Gammaproteobacteria bacterium]
MSMTKGFVVAALALSVAACSWVKLTEQGEDVRVFEPSQVANCERVGKTTVRTSATAAGLARHADKVQTELDTLARNSAVDIGGDTVVPLDKPVDGVQIYEVYRCLR